MLIVRVLVRLVVVIVVVVVTIHITIHKAHAQCSCTGMTLGVIVKILIIHIVSRCSVIRIRFWILPDATVLRCRRSRVDLVVVVVCSERWSACKGWVMSLLLLCH
jgi:hypothetical protein